jgi:hypothetical protein
MTEPRELPDTITPLSIPAVWNALLLRWETLGVPVVRAAVELKLAHIHLETGLKSCHCWNLGNCKYSGKHPSHWTFFACGEEVSVQGLRDARSFGPHLVQLVREYAGGSGVPRYSIKLTPPHPWTKFAAFETLADGVDAQLGYLKRHASVLSALQTGDPEEYNDALVAARYYTAGQSQYLAILRQRLEMVRRECAGLDWGDVS